MPIPVKPCPSRNKLMWIKEESIERVDENTTRFRCPPCQPLVRRRLVELGANAAGPIKPASRLSRHSLRWRYDCPVRWGPRPLGGPERPAVRVDAEGR